MKKTKNSKVDKKLRLTCDLELITECKINLQVENESKDVFKNKKALKEQNIEETEKRFVKFEYNNISKKQLHVNSGTSTKKNIHEFRKKIKQHKNQNILKRMFRKLYLNNIYRQPVQFFPFQQLGGQKDKCNIEVPTSFINIFRLFSIAFVLFFTVFSTFTLMYEEIFRSEMQIIFISGITWNIVEIITDLASIFTKPKKQKNLFNIAKNYIDKNNIINLLCLSSLIADFVLKSNLLFFLRFGFLLKYSDCEIKIEKLEQQLIDSFNAEKKWILIKLLVKNFSLAHIFAVILVLMTQFQSHSWIDEMNLAQSPWYQQYIWSYYWSINIMLTVGFGDIKAANYQEAIFLIFIETISCLTLAYNINCIGNLLAEMRNRDLEQKMNKKTLKKLVNKNKIGPQINQKLVNHIQNSFNTQNHIDFQKQQHFIQNLSENLKHDLKIEMNNHLVKNITFFKNFTNKTIQNIAIKLQNRLAKPGQLLIFQKEAPKFILLKEGEVGYYSKFGNLRHRQIAIDVIQSNNSSEAKLISLEFMSNFSFKNYDVRSKGYSYILEMNWKQFLQTIKDKKVDLEFFFTQLHKEKANFSEFEVIYCNFCAENHSKFRCPKLHYTPLKQMVIFRFLKASQKDKNQRSKFQREPMKQSKSPFFSGFHRPKFAISAQSNHHIPEKQGTFIQVPDYLDDKNLSMKKSFKNFALTSSFRDVCEEFSFDKVKNYSYYFPKNNSSRLNKRKQKIRSCKSLKLLNGTF